MGVGEGIFVGEEGGSDVKTTGGETGITHINTVNMAYMMLNMKYITTVAQHVPILSHPYYRGSICI